MITRGSNYNRKKILMKNSFSGFLFSGTAMVKTDCKGVKDNFLGDEKFLSFNRCAADTGRVVQKVCMVFDVK